MGTYLCESGGRQSSGCSKEGEELHCVVGLVRCGEGKAYGTPGVGYLNGFWVEKTLLQSRYQPFIFIPEKTVSAEYDMRM